MAQMKCCSVKEIGVCPLLVSVLIYWASLLSRQRNTAPSGLTYTDTSHQR